MNHLAVLLLKNQLYMRIAQFHLFLTTVPEGRPACYIQCFRFLKFRSRAVSHFHPSIFPRAVTTNLGRIELEIRYLDQPKIASLVLRIRLINTIVFYIRMLCLRTQLSSCVSCSPPMSLLWQQTLIVEARKLFS